MTRRLKHAKTAVENVPSVGYSDWNAYFVDESGNTADLDVYANLSEDETVTGKWTFNSSLTASENVTIASNKKLYFRDAAIFAHSDSDGYLVIEADSGVKINNMLYGSMFGDDVSITITVSAKETYYAMGAGLTGGTCNGFTHANSVLTVDVAGNYKVDWSGTLACATANQKVSMAVMINTTPQANTEGSTKLTSVNDEKSVAGSGIITLAAGDAVKFCIENETGTNNILVTHATMSIVRVDS